MTLQPVGREETAVEISKAGRRLHPAIWPTGIQNEREQRFPSPPSTLRRSGAQLGTSLRPNSRTPRNAASRKNAVRPFIAKQRRKHVGDRIRHSGSQLVPNWNGITTPVTTPMPKAIREKS